MTIALTRNAKQSGNYWLCLMLEGGGDSGSVESSLRTATAMEWKSGGGYIAANLGTDWVNKWSEVERTLPTIGAANSKFALIPSSSMPGYEEAKVSARSIPEITKIAQNYWLIDYLENDRIECHFQVVVDREKDPCGWESFARIRLENGELINGFKIIEASKALNIKHLVDRHLHVQSVRDFNDFALKGNLFINFIPDFIQRPEKYMEGLQEAAKKYGILTRRIVLEFPVGEKTLNLSHIKAVIDCCRAKGFQISLDDITNPATCETLVEQFSPDWVKIDRTISTNLAVHAKSITHLINFAHNKNCVVLAEGIEDEAAFLELKKMGVDQFQGWHFGKPERPTKG